LMFRDVSVAPEDFAFSLKVVESLPFTIYLTTSWNPVYFDLNPYYVLIGIAPFFVQSKIHLTIAISIATERILALSFPVFFCKLSSRSYATFFLLLGFLFGTLDVILEFIFAPFKHSINCPSPACFVGAEFRYYAGISNFKIDSIYSKCFRSVVMTWTEKNFKQINRNCAGILLSSLVFVTLPTVVGGVCAITGCRVSTNVGPLYLANNLPNLFILGVCSSVIHIALNKNMRDLAAQCISNHAISSIMPTSTKIRIACF
uniref:G protein-coupled receptor n=1 Tax=Angiostrongylus cantonensis TaxID=6313 RepID=A0A0K0D8R3_ANGCA